jgi:hypothetical protein
MDEIVPPLQRAKQPEGRRIIVAPMRQIIHFKP